MNEKEAKIEGNDFSSEKLPRQNESEKDPYEERVDSPTAKLFGFDRFDERISKSS